MALTPKFKEWKVQMHRDPCDCSQGLPLKVSGMSENQGPTHYCPVCRWGFWFLTIKPSAAQIIDYKKTHRDANELNMSYQQYKNEPASKWGSSPENRMIDMLGGKKQPGFLTNGLKKVWTKKYCDRFPNSDIAKKEKEKLKKD